MYVFHIAEIDYLVDVYCHAEFHNNIVTKLRKACESTSCLSDYFIIKTEVLNHECRSRCYF